MGNKKWDTIIHFLIWSILFGMPLVFPDLPDSIETRLRIKYYSHLVALFLAFYFTYGVLIPYLLFRRRTWEYGLALALVIVAVNAVGYAVTEGLELEGIFQPSIVGVDTSFTNKGTAFSLITTLIALMIATSLKLVERFLQEEKLQSQVQEEQLNIELAMLKNQISPHFFFNTLNTIYVLIETDTSAAQAAIHKLSQLMRYLLYETQKPWASLDKEVAFVKDYIELMEMRLPENVEIDLHIQVDQDAAKIPPLLFISLIENAFKHGLSYQQTCKLSFDIRQEQGRLWVKTTNPDHPHQDPEHKQGLGLANLKRRLNLLYPDEENVLEIDTQAGLFSVTLSIPLHEPEMSGRR